MGFEVKMQIKYQMLQLELGQSITLFLPLENGVGRGVEGVEEYLQVDFSCPDFGMTTVSISSLNKQPEDACFSEK